MSVVRELKSKRKRNTNEKEENKEKKGEKEKWIELCEKELRKNEESWSKRIKVEREKKK